MSTKKKLYIVVLIWAAVALQIFITKRIDRESQMVTQVMSDGVENVTAAEVKLYAHYGDETMTEAAREKILQRVGEKLGIISGYDIITSTEGENTSTTFVKKGENGDTTIRLISMEQTNADGSTIQENYLMTEIALISRQKISTGVRNSSTRSTQIWGSPAAAISICAVRKKGG